MAHRWAGQSTPNSSPTASPTSQVEIVERKGIGHPDSIIDGACEAVSIALSKYYLDNFDVIFHHNVDKGLLVGGKSQRGLRRREGHRPHLHPRGGEGDGRRPRREQDEKVPVETIAKEAIANYIRGTMRFLDPKKHTRVETMIRAGSPDLVAVFLRKKSMPVANDTSVGVGFAPLSETERVVFDIEQMLNSSKFKKKYPAVGEDIKVMGMRVGKKLNATVAAAMVSGQIKDASEYASIMKDVRDEVDDLVAKSTPRR